MASGETSSPPPDRDASSTTRPNLVATTISSRIDAGSSARARPMTRSECPVPYALAVSIEPYAVVDHRVQCGDADVIVDLAPAGVAAVEGPRPTEGPGADAEGRDVRAVQPERVGGGESKSDHDRVLPRRTFGVGGRVEALRRGAGSGRYRASRAVAAGRVGPPRSRCRRRSSSRSPRDRTAAGPSCAETRSRCRRSSSIRPARSRSARARSTKARTSSTGIPVRRSRMTTSSRPRDSSSKTRWPPAVRGSSPSSPLRS